MYFMDGIIYELIIVAICGGIGSTMTLLLSKFWNKEYRKKKKNKSLMISGILMVAAMIVVAVNDITALVHPEIKIFEGYYDCWQRKQREYNFENDEEYKGFDLMLVPKKVIYPENFEEGELYRIYYEANTNIIVRVEKID